MAETDPFRALARNAFASAEAPPPPPRLRINSRRGLVTPRVPTDARTEYEYLYGERVAIMVDSHIPEAEAEQATLDEIGCLEFWFFTSAFVRTLQKAA